MAKFEIIMPKLGESIIEATITRWLKKEGDSVQEDDSLLEIATDKVDSEIPSPVEGRIIKTLFAEGDVVPVGKVIAIIEMDGDAEIEEEPSKTEVHEEKENNAISGSEVKEIQSEIETGDFASSTRFYSPLVKSIAKAENISLTELEQIPGTGTENRVTKQDILNFLQNRGQNKAEVRAEAPKQRDTAPAATIPLPKYETPKVTSSMGDEIVEMDGCAN